MTNVELPFGLDKMGAIRGQLLREHNTNASMLGWAGKAWQRCVRGLCMVHPSLCLAHSSDLT
eukprot:SAG22_NODE_738_length_7524_cov_57.525522_5_plen_62_part_00